MSTLKNNQYLPEYRSFSNDIIREFYIPSLSYATEYKRAVGYFSSSSLIQITNGILKLIKNGGKMKIIASPHLSQDDIEAIDRGYAKKEDIVGQATKEFFENGLIEKNELLKRRYQLLAWLIKHDYLDIRLALIENNKTLGMYHEKIGIISDGENKLAFTGSMNETHSAMNLNYESFDVYTTWNSEESKLRVELKENHFDEIWNNENDFIKTVEFPEAIREEVLKEYDEPDFEKIENDEELYELSNLEGNEASLDVNTTLSKKYPKVPDWIELRDYQLEAIESWRNHDFHGVFDMATGTGKTITGLSAAADLSDKLERNLAVVIVVPYQHLVDQWVEDVEAFNMKPIIGYSASKQRNWESRLKDSIDLYSAGYLDHFSLVTTNSTFSLDRIQAQLKRIKGNFLLIIDEAHNFGSRKYSKSLLENANYRLALSATLERHHDPDGTQKLYDYFGEKCIIYTLEDAINSRKLTPYEYHVVLVYLNEEEKEEYIQLTKEISKRIMRDKSGKVKFSESAKYYLIKRARLIAGVNEKTLKLKEEMTNFKNDSHILVYCGATTILDDEYDEEDGYNQEVRQIDKVTRMLGNDLDMKVGQFTSAESSAERETIKKRFANNDNLQALIAIRCLDEGVDIPSIKSAFILASSTNPKEYIQRRGRVLRKFEGKDRAIIYDFVTLPDPINLMFNYSDAEVLAFKGLILREIERMKDFANSAINSYSTDKFIYDLKSIFNITEEGEDINEEFIEE